MSDDEVSRPEVRKGRGNLPVTHLTTGEREELRQTKKLVIMRSDGLSMTFPVGGSGVMQVSYAEESPRQNDAEEKRCETTRQNDAENVTPKRDDQRDDQRDDPRDTIWPYQRDTTAFISGYKAGFAEGYEDCKKNMLAVLNGSGAFAND